MKKQCASSLPTLTRLSAVLLAALTCQGVSAAWSWQTDDAARDLTEIKATRPAGESRLDIRFSPQPGIDPLALCLGDPMGIEIKSTAKEPGVRHVLVVEGLREAVDLGPDPVDKDDDDLFGDDDDGFFDDSNDDIFAGGDDDFGGDLDDIGQENPYERPMFIQTDRATAGATDLQMTGAAVLWIGGETADSERRDALERRLNNINCLRAMQADSEEYIGSSVVYLQDSVTFAKEQHWSVGDVAPAGERGAAPTLTVGRLGVLMVDEDSDAHLHLAEGTSALFKPGAAAIVQVNGDDAGREDAPDRLLLTTAGDVSIEGLSNLEIYRLEGDDLSLGNETLQNGRIERDGAGRYVVTYSDWQAEGPLANVLTHSRQEALARGSGQVYDMYASMLSKRELAAWTENVAVKPFGMGTTQAMSSALSSFAGLGALYETLPGHLDLLSAKQKTEIREKAERRKAKPDFKVQPLSVEVFESRQRGAAIGINGETRARENDRFNRDETGVTLRADGVFERRPGCWGLGVSYRDADIENTARSQWDYRPWTGTSSVVAVNAYRGWGDIKHTMTLLELGAAFAEDTVELDYMGGEFKYGADRIKRKNFRVGVRRLQRYDLDGAGSYVGWDAGAALEYLPKVKYDINVNGETLFHVREKARRMASVEAGGYVGVNMDRWTMPAVKLQWIGAAGVTARAGDLDVKQTVTLDAARDRLKGRDIGRLTGFGRLGLECRYDGTVIFARVQYEAGDRHYQRGTANIGFVWGF